MNLPRILITGGAGFVGHHVVEHFVKNGYANVVVLDKLTYASHALNRLRHNGMLYHPRVKVITYDFISPISPGIIEEIGEVDYILHLGAESHVDNSIKDPALFVDANVVGTMNILEFARIQDRLKCFIYFSTDEVYGAAPDGTDYSEDSPLTPANPYSATKACGEMLVHAYRNTYGVPSIITRCMNIFGERQDVEKFIPLCLKKILAQEPITIHATPDKKAAARRGWIHARNVASCLWFLLEGVGAGRIESGEIINIPGQVELGADEIAYLISTHMGYKLAPTLEYVDFHSDRPGHDLRYGLNGDKLASLGWVPPKGFEDSFLKMIQWMIQQTNKQWLD